MYLILLQFIHDRKIDLKMYFISVSKLRNSKFKSQVFSTRGVITLSALTEYMQTKATHPIFNFEHEFRQLFSGQTATWTVAKKADNIKKNRYGNILPYDHTRVVLKPSMHVPNSDYINASYIDGYEKRKAYIATQGPKENHLVDFWRMVWQENTGSIIMVTNLVENGRVKCDQYWPDEDFLYGDILTVLTSTERNINTITRQFKLCNVNTDECRQVNQYQIFDWPDQQVPMYASSVLSIRQQMRETNPINSGPIVVHCSAGIGRTGTFIAIDALLQQAWHEDAVDVFAFVNRMRLQRINMVQTLHQYVFVYEAILEAVQCGNTKVLCNRIAIYFRDISRKSSTEQSDLSEQFLKLEKTSRKLTMYQCATALQFDNLPKHRDINYLPSDWSRVPLKSPDGTMEYINAIFVDGFAQRNQYLMTQMPLPNTVNDFWQMIYDYRSSIIVMLNSSDQHDEHLGNYWPSQGMDVYGHFQVDVVTFQDKGSFYEQHMKLFDLDHPEDSEPHRVVQLQFTDWDCSNLNPNSVEALVKLVHQVEIWYRKLQGTITIHCLDGCTRSSIFCVASILSEQLRTENAADVFQVVRKLRSHRPEAIISEDQYKFCYEMAVEMAKDYL